MHAAMGSAEPALLVPQQLFVPFPVDNTKVGAVKTLFCSVALPEAQSLHVPAAGWLVRILCQQCGAAVVSAVGHNHPSIFVASITDFRYAGTGDHSYTPARPGPFLHRLAALSPNASKVQDSYCFKHIEGSPFN